MNLLEEHNYGLIAHIKSERTEKNPLHVSELNIKMEYDPHARGPGEENDLEYVNADLVEEHDVDDNRDSGTEIKRKFESDTSEQSDSDDGNSVISNLSLSDMKKACVLQTCLGLLDSSSSDDDELMLLWLMYRNRKKKLRKRRRLC